MSAVFPLLAFQEHDRNHVLRRRISDLGTAPVQVMSPRIGTCPIMHVH